MAKRYQSSRGPVLLLATTFVLSSGIVVCTFIVTAFSDSAIYELAGVLGLFALTMFFLWTLRSNPDETEPRRGILDLLIGLVRRQNVHRKRRAYRPVRKKYLQIDQLGNNQPPTVESIRHQINHLNTFVAADNRKTPPDSSKSESAAPEDR